MIRLNKRTIAIITLIITAISLSQRLSSTLTIRNKL